MLGAVALAGGKEMKPLLYFGAAYLAVVSAATFWSASNSGNTPTADQIASLPSPSLLFGAGEGATIQGAMIDGATAVLFWYFAAKAKH